MKIRVATWNLNTWVNRKNGILNDTLWKWADKHLNADIVIFTEAATPPPHPVTSNGWSIIHRPGGFPGRSNWGTIIGGRNLRVERITHVGKGKKYELDKFFPGSFTAADVWIDDEHFATVIGLYLPYRKDKNKDFIGHPVQDLDTMTEDFVQLQRDRKSNLIIAGDLNDEYYSLPSAFEQLGRSKKEIVDLFESEEIRTFEQEWDRSGKYKMDYLFMNKELARKVTFKKGGIKAFRSSLKISDHAPLLAEITI